VRFAWVGVHAEGIPALDALLTEGVPIVGVLTLRPDLAIKRSARGEYEPLCARHGVPLYHIANINEPEALGILKLLEPDVAIVVGWHHVVRSEALRLARIGMIGAHASLLPHNRGSAPINWAVIRGERETGNTLYWMAEGGDAGDIIAQTAFPITPYDTCATLYEKVAESNKSMLLRVVPRLMAGERPGQPQPPTDEPVLPRRRPADGCIDWDRPSRTVYDFIRALTRPYPGAFSSLGGRRWYIWEAALPPTGTGTGAPGTVLGPIVSPDEHACGQLVACGDGAVTVLAVSNDDGAELRGPALSDQPWRCLRWQDG
jgi:methionyl-tRNA formyltransferase